MDYKFYAKVGNKYLKNKKLVSKGRDEFECREEPTQIINQMKKDGKIDKKAKVKIQKIKEYYKAMSWSTFLKDYEKDAYPLVKHDGIEKHRDDSKVHIFTNDGAVAFVFVDKSVVKVFHLERNVLLKGVKGSGSALLKDIISTYKDRPIELTAQNTKPL